MTSFELICGEKQSITMVEVEKLPVEVLCFMQNVEFLLVKCMTLVDMGSTYPETEVTPCKCLNSIRPLIRCHVSNERKKMSWFTSQIMKGRISADLNSFS